MAAEGAGEPDSLPCPFRPCAPAGVDGVETMAPILRSDREHPSQRCGVVMQTMGVLYERVNTLYIVKESRLTALFTTFHSGFRKFSSRAAEGICLDYLQQTIF
jgi:hypothetical protein